MKKIISLALVLFASLTVFSQDTLPKFTLEERSDRVTISWKNPYPLLNQLNIQRSYDSLRNFTTIYSATSPQLPQNGYTDTRPASNGYFYRIFYVIEGGAYFFTKPKRAGGGGNTVAPNAQPRDAGVGRDLTNGAFTNVIPGDRRNITVIVKDAASRRLSINAFRNFRDSLLRQTRDTLYPVNDTTVGISRFAGIAAYKSSSFVFVNRDGYVNVSLPEVNERKYSVRFFEEDGSPLFEIHILKESPLILDKSNFIHAGWFLFELYEDNKLKEKNRLYVPKEF